MNWLEVFVLSIVQGFTEFLPVSSSAHLVFIPQLFGWSDQGIAFDVAVHVGTLFAVLIYFKRDIFFIVKDWFISLKLKKTYGESKLAWWIILATIPAGLAGLLFSSFIQDNLRSPLVIASTTIIFGIVLWICDKYSGDKDLKNLTLKIVLVIGIAQALAMIPGVSRSGITLSAGLFLGLSRTSAARFSFLISIPIIILAGGYEGIKLISSPEIVEWGKIAGAIALSFISGYICIFVFLAAIQKYSMTPFVIYRLFLGIVLFSFFW